MSWSMSAVSYRMAGTGSWKDLFIDESSQQLYSEIYPLGVPMSWFDDRLRGLINSWQQSNIVSLDDQNIVPIGPIITNDDIGILNSWFRDISDSMCDAILYRISEYKSLALRMAGDKSSIKQDVENIMTIQICAQTLDSGVFSLLRKGLIGSYPSRGFAGNFFFWGYAFDTGPRRIFGFTTYRSLGGLMLHVIRSHDLNRKRIKDLLNEHNAMEILEEVFNIIEASGNAATWEYLYSKISGEVVESLIDVNILKPDDPPRFAIPNFCTSNIYMKHIIQLNREVSEKIFNNIVNRINELKSLVSMCSFSQCFWPDILCMLFHLAYSYAADKLVEMGKLPDFPKSAGGEWGIWMS
ncbi:MAG: hypothetical protein SVZ03_06915 [Spirochaetota bacterium]|nr:hypothetical protein [Spirochaetota bacterium]